MRVLIIKLTSMGDLMHALPALTDAANAIPGIEFDWVVDQAFAEVPLWHPNVRRVIKTAHRRWRKQVRQSLRNGELSAFYHDLNADAYDAIIDLQGNMKSAAVCLLRKGKAHGMDKTSCRERPAHWAYKYQHFVDPKLHAVERMRVLMAEALGYKKPDTTAQYNIDLSGYAVPQLDFELPERYLMFVHNASWLTKLWPLQAWQALVKKAEAAGYSILIPSGSDEEYERGKQIAAVSDHAFAMPRLALNAVAALMSRAQGAVCSDTGLAHLAALAAIPAITIYGSTDTQLIGTHGDRQQHIVSKRPCSPCYKRICPLDDAVDGQPLCMAEIDADQVWHGLQTLLQAK